MTEINNIEANHDGYDGARPLTPRGPYAEYLRQENDFEFIEHQTIGRVVRRGQQSVHSVVTYINTDSIFVQLPDDENDFNLILENYLSLYPYPSHFDYTSLSNYHDVSVRIDTPTNTNTNNNININNIGLFTKNITNKSITKNDECPISYEMININDIYVECKQCKYHFLEESIKTHLNNFDTCPMCRNKWQFPIIRYRNIAKLTTFELYLKIIASIKINNSHNDYRHNYKISSYNYKTRHNKKWFYGK